MKNLNNYLFIIFLVILSIGVSDAQINFTNMGTSLGSIPGASNEDCAVDMNGDFLDDVVRVTLNNIFIDYQQPDGTFIQGQFPIDLQNYPTWSICAGDIDGNGFNDLLFASGQAVSFIYANDDATGYTEHFIDDYIFSQRSTLADIDNDGHLDAFVCHDIDQSHPYRNDGFGNLSEDQTLIETVNLEGNYSAIWVDYDNDGDTDLYITKCSLGSFPGDLERTNAMYRNNADGTYTEVAAEIGMADNAQSWTTAFADFDNDGDFDALIVNHDFQNRFMVNDGAGNFTESIVSTGIPPGDLGAWESTGADFNNDGFIDIYSELDKELYLNNGDMTFTGYNLPFDNGGIGDFNNDGFLDVIRQNSLWINDGNDNNWLKINTQGIISNKNGIGARVELYGDWGIQIREVRAGESFSPMSSLAVHFGLGTATAVDSVVVKWPSGVRTNLVNPEINATYNIPEAQCLLANSTLTANGATEFCVGGSVQLSAPDGFDTYTWSTGELTQTINITEAGNYSAILGDANECVSFSDPITVSIIEDVIPTIVLAGEEAFCFGESATLSTNTDANPVWSNNMTGQSITVTESGNYFVQTESVCATGSLTSEEIIITVLDPQTPIVEDAIINEAGAATIMASGSGLEWYDSPIGGNLLATGSNFEIDFLEMDSSVYVESHLVEGGGLQEGGKEDNAGSGGLPTTGAFSYFDAFEPFTIVRVTVYVPDNAPAGVRDIQLLDRLENVLAEASFNLDNGEHELELNFEVPAGIDLSLRCTQNNLFRNDGGVSYPYAIGDLGKITTSFFGEDFYYYFYNWIVESEKTECVSERVIANASIAVSTDELEGKLTGFSIYPNPTTENVTIAFEALQTMDLDIRLYDAIGREVKAFSELKISQGSQIRTVELEDMPMGIYHLRLSSDGKSVSKKIVIK